MTTKLLNIGVCLCAAIWLSACQTVDEKTKIDYGATTDLPPLEVPPDLSGIPDTDQYRSRNPMAPSPAIPNRATDANEPAGAANYSEYAEGGARQPTSTDGVLPQYPDIQLVRDGQTRYLVVKVEPAQLWDKVRDFFPKLGLELERDEPAIGLVETEWGENRAVISSKSMSGFARLLGSLRGLPVRDKYRIRLERGVKPGTTEIYLTHTGMEQVSDRRGSVGASASSAPTYWQVRKPNPEIEAEILQRLVVHIGGDPAAAKTIAATVAAQPQAPTSEPTTASTANLTRNGKGTPVLTLQDSLDRAWRRVGLSLDRGGFTVEDRDRSRGIYYVRYNDPDKPKKSGLFSSPKPTAPDQYQIRLESADKGTHVEVLNKDGVADTTKASERILSLLYEQLK